MRGGRRSNIRNLCNIYAFINRNFWSGTARNRKIARKSPTRPRPITISRRRRRR
jgi:hypothetical protein